MKKLTTALLTVCLCLTVIMPCVGCGNKLSDVDWHNATPVSVGSEGFTIFDFRSREANHFELDYSSNNQRGYDYEKSITEQRDSLKCVYVYVDEEFQGESSADAKMTRPEKFLEHRLVDYNENMPEKEIREPFENGSWIDPGRTSGGEDYYVSPQGKVYDGKIPAHEPYVVMQEWIHNNFKAFKKTDSTDSSITFAAKPDKIGEIAPELKKIYADSDVSEISIRIAIFQLKNGEKSYYTDYIQVSDGNGLLFAMRPDAWYGGAFIEPYDYDHGFYYNFIAKPNFTLKGGEGIDYDEYYFADNAVKIYTPNNTDANKREAYLVADVENDTAKYITKNADGTFNAQTISVDEFKSRRQNLTMVYFEGLQKNGYGYLQIYRYFTKYINRSDCWRGDGINFKMPLYDVTYKNVEIQFCSKPSYRIESASFDYIMTSGGQSVTYHFELTDGGSTTVQVPEIN